MQPLTFSGNYQLIAGHGRKLTAILLGLKDVPVIRVGHLVEAELRAYRIADNKLTELGEWDGAMLRDEIAALLAEDFDLSLLEITDEDLDALLRGRGRGRHPRTAGHAGAGCGRPLATWFTPPDLWRQHILGRRRAVAGAM